MNRLSERYNQAAFGNFFLITLRSAQVYFSYIFLYISVTYFCDFTIIISDLSRNRQIQYYLGMFGNLTKIIVIILLANFKHEH